MNALELAEMLEQDHDISGCDHLSVALMLRKQDAAITLLREALEMIDDTAMGGSKIEMLCRNALAATEELK